MIEQKGNFLGVPLMMLFMLFVVGCENEHIAKGHEIFSRYCTPCHGESGAGDGYNAHHLDPHPRDLTDSEEDYMAKLDNEEILEVLKVGGYGVELAGTMPAWGKVFSEEELWSVVAYVRTLHPNEGNEIVFMNSEKPVFDAKRVRYPKPRESRFVALMESLAPDEDAFEEQVALGEELFEEYGCIGCHAIQGNGGEVGPDLTRAGFMLQTQFIFRWILNPQAFLSKTRMPNLDLPEEDAFAVALFLSTQDGSSSGGEDAPAESEHDSGEEGI